MFDTNVWLAAQYSNGLARKIVGLLADHKFHAIISPPLVHELRRKVEEYFPPALYQLVAGYPAFVQSLCEMVSEPLPDLPEETSRVLRDPTDEPVLTTALAGSASLIVTLDQDLLVLKQVKDIGIIHPRTLLYILGEE